jgi:CRISPR-associated endonuclease/helicase Cas3
MEINQLHRSLWAKSIEKDSAEKEGEYLLAHSINTAMVARAICRQLPFPAEERANIEKALIEACAYHDLGKAATGFQRMLREPNNHWGHRHETLSTAIAFHLNPYLDACARFAILTHHKSIPAGITSEGEKFLPWAELPPHFGFSSSDTTWQQMLEELRANFEPFSDLLTRLAKAVGLSQQSFTREAALFDLGINPVWLERDLQYQQEIAPREKWQASLLRGLLITSDHMASARNVKARKHFKPLDVPRISDYKARIVESELPQGQALLPFQRRAGEIEGSAILKAPTGSGKTLAALLWAARNQTENGRFFYVLPYTASINAMADRLKRIFDADIPHEEHRVGVLHHRNADYLFRTMEEKELPQHRNKSARLLSSLTREMYHPIRVCTPHQILRFALCGRGWEIGLAEFPRACFVFDEVHAFEPLLTGLTLATIRLLTNHMGARVLFASATIPRFLEDLIKSNTGIDDAHTVAPDPFNSLDSKVYGKLRHRIEVREGSLLEGLPHIANEIEMSGETALIVCNHVATSQAVWRQLRENYGFKSARLLHARFNGKDRNCIEQAIMSEKKRPCRAAQSKILYNENGITRKEELPVLVATQAVEVSLDLDYNRGYTEPAPADALGQRFGRINRKGTCPIPAQVVVFAEPSAGYLYDQTLTDSTVELMRQAGNLTEAQLTEIVDAIYANGYPETALQEFNKGNENTLINNFHKEIIAGTHRPWTDDILRSTDGQIEVLPICLLDEFARLRSEHRYVEAKQRLVPIRAQQKFKAEKMGALSYNKELHEWVIKLKYSSEGGLDLSA